MGCTLEPSGCLPCVCYQPREPKSTLLIALFLKQGVNFVFTLEMENISRGLIADLAKRPILFFPDWDAVADDSRVFCLCYDACIYGVGAVLE